MYEYIVYIPHINTLFTPYIHLIQTLSPSFMYCLKHEQECIIGFKN